MDRYSRFFLYTISNLVTRKSRIKRTFSLTGNLEKRSVFLMVSPRLVSAEVVEFRELGIDRACYPVCPNCDCTFEREYQGYCDRCGQKLAWNLYDQQFGDEEAELEE